MSGFEMSLDLRGALAAVDQIVESSSEAARPAAQAGAQLLYEEVKRNVSRIRRVTGLLEKSIYQFFDKDRSGSGKASYKISWRKGRNSAEKALAGLYTAPHGYLVEYGHLQRYEVVRLPNGRFVVPVRPEAKGKKRPGRNASQAAKDAYYMPRKGGPIQIAARPFIRPAIAKFPEVERVMRERYFAELKARGVRLK